MILQLRLYEILKPRFGEKDANDLIEILDERMDDKLNNKMGHLVTKEDLASTRDRLKEEIVLTREELKADIALTIAALLFLLKK